LLPFCAPIKPFGQAVPWFEHLTCELSDNSGLGGRDHPDFDRIDTSLDKPIEPVSLGFQR
jgi:hypothetical protein